MNHYTLNCLFPSDISEEELNKNKEEISSLLEKSGAKIESAEKPVVKELGYAIKDKKSSFLISVVFSLTSDKIKEIEKSLKERKDLLRFLITKNQKERRKSKERRTRKPKETKEVKKEETKKEKPKVEFKEIEKKLDEILGE
jgi:ribosomal protein S6